MDFVEKKVQDCWRNSSKGFDGRGEERKGKEEKGKRATSSSEMNTAGRIFAHKDFREKRAARFQRGQSKMQRTKTSENAADTLRSMAEKKRKKKKKRKKVLETKNTAE